MIRSLRNTNLVWATQCTDDGLLLVMVSVYQLTDYQYFSHENDENDDDDCED